MRAWKLFTQRKDGTIGPLFVNRKQRVPVGEWVRADENCNPGHLKFRPGWHCAHEKRAPHLVETGRVWKQVDIKGYIAHKKPECQGGKWYVAKWMKVLSDENNTRKHNQTR